jgi:hypothetical protein
MEHKMTEQWTQKQAIALCIVLESIVPTYGCHVALTGGNLYKHGPRKDCDVLFYRIRQEPRIRMDEMWTALEAVGFYKRKGWGWCYKAEYEGRNVDCFFPEETNKGPNGEELGSGGEVIPPVMVLKDGTRSDEEILF